MSQQYGPEWRDYKQPIRSTQAVPTKRQKYGAVPHVVLPNLLLLPLGSNFTAHGDLGGGIRFSSKREAMRFVELRQQIERGEISDLLLQEQFALHAVNPQGVKVQIGTCRMDFTYTKNGQRIREDVKSAGTKGITAYRQRKRHVEIEHGITVEEV